MFRPNIITSGLTACRRLHLPSTSTRFYHSHSLRLRTRSGKTLLNLPRSQSSAYSTVILQPDPTKPSLFGRIVKTILIISVSMAAGAGTGLMLSGSDLVLPTDAETLLLFKPDNESAKEIDEYIKHHALAESLRNDPDMLESRPHLKLPVEMRGRTLTGGTLTGEGKIVVPPYLWLHHKGERSVSIFYLGENICGHPGIVHGGLIATILDEGLARTCFPALPNKVAVTANLSVNYRKPAPANSYFVLKATTTKLDGRKAWVEGRIESLPVNGEEPVVYSEATALFIEPKYANMMPKLFKSDEKPGATKVEAEQADEGQRPQA